MPRTIVVKSPVKWIAEKSRVADHAREVADVSDRWFLTVTGGIVSAGGWARREAWIVADSAVAAFATAVDVAKKLSVPVETAGAPQRTPRATVATPPSLDLVAACVPDEASSVDDVEARWRDGLARDPSARHSRAGVVPLLQALGRTVAKHTHAGYASLGEDPRFWTLIHLLQNLGQPSIVAGDEVVTKKELEEGADEASP